MSRRNVFALACSLAPGLLALGLAAGCTDKDGGTPPPAGMAGAGPAGTAQAGGAGTGGQPEGGRGFGVNPGGAAMGSPQGAASQPHGQPGSPTGMASPHGGGAASQPAGGAHGGTAPQVIKGGGQDAVPPPAPAKSVVSGQVTETMNAAGYTYMKVKAADGNEVWVAIGETQMAVGTQVTVDESVTMRDFHSNTLNRTFPSIVFGTLR